LLHDLLEARIIAAHQNKTLLPGIVNIDFTTGVIDLTYK
jgi:hypothetical protein